ncbi:hypothetical protein PF005_g31613 [Phytophthora fragariae]|uniref:Uncharacterized protein n=1 Tax=Phytophthora fragariae TaxID=53985 RepID=A0A6A3V853_9STRA|nr:hypothetical protein PF003_g10562 [Phytophthora fragariae]KAE8905357.1 hypothetical protein PF003_g10564 [Phytophthora fragariae]KAE8918003.1 hypothetical protein PF009_g31682 [Phytophthora fragariae]KAE8958115.1 hypothetical protein PF011_g30899 [Phytophthora fragariae]KAE9058654.1 hypothetical protein PF007_g31228 [Phytophthora fragariae]
MFRRMTVEARVKSCAAFCFVHCALCGRPRLGAEALKHLRLYDNFGYMYVSFTRVCKGIGLIRGYPSNVSVAPVGDPDSKIGSAASASTREHV